MEGLVGGSVCEDWWCESFVGAWEEMGDGRRRRRWRGRDIVKPTGRVRVQFGGRVMWRRVSASLRLCVFGRKREIISGAFN